MHLPGTEKAELRFSPEAALQAHGAIVSAGGREVFFAGTPGADGRLESVRVLARGNAAAVPAIMEGLDTREVVVHNHPSGDLCPSDADLSLASLFGNQGHGMYIVDNEVLRVYVVVEPFLPKKASLLNTRELDGLFAPGGPMSKHLESFEVRPQQSAMMELIASAFNTDSFAVVEAPTGVGKTVAYLVPAVLWAVNNKERVVVSTRTINLQEQIVFKDIPLLQRCLKVKFEACLVKGRGNYLCWRKLDRAFAEMSLFEDEQKREQLLAVAEWAEKTPEGSLSDLPFVPARELWEQVNSEADTCAMGRCPNQQKCFVGRARKAMCRADILVANHHMLFSDMAIKHECGDFHSMAVLPAFHRVVFDEAHSVEDSATEYLGAAASHAAVMSQLGKFHRMEGGRERGLLPMLKIRLTRDCPGLSVDGFERLQGLLDDILSPALALLRQSMDAAFKAMRGVASELCGQIGRDIKWRLTEEVLALPEVRELHTDYVRPAVDHARAFIQNAETLQRLLRDVPAADNGQESPLQNEMLELGAYVERLRALTGALAESTSPELAPNTVRWIEIDARNERHIRAVRCPLEVGKPLSEWLYGQFKTLVMTSATLTVRKRFDYLFNRLGLEEIPAERMRTKALDSPFEYHEQALLCVPRDGVDPADRQFPDFSVETIRQILSITGGHAFVLFTSFHALNHAYRKLEPELAAAGITPLCQGKATRTQLLEDFRNDPASVLFATDSFWEGVDVAGEALQCVILPKLPFRVPTEPIQEARAEAIDAAGGNSFLEYSVPQAVIKFRQGFGRLIRRKSDWGAVIILDKRVVTKHYGRIFLESLPDLPITVKPRQDVCSELEKFFDERRKKGIS